MGSYFNKAELDARLGHEYNGKQVTVCLSCDVDCVVFCDGERCFDEVANIPHNLKCNIGKHTIRFVSSMFSNVFRDISVEFWEEGRVDPISISLAKDVLNEQKNQQRIIRDAEKALYEANKKKTLDEKKKAEKERKELEYIASQELKEKKRATADAKAKQREKNKQILKKYKEGKYGYWMPPEDDMKVISAAREKREILAHFFFGLFLLMVLLFAVCLIVIIVGWFKGTGHGFGWTLAFWGSLAVGVVSGLITELDIFDF